MKRVLIIPALVIAIILTNLVSANCPLGASLVNQEPHPAVPGEYVKLLFQLNGLKNQECGDVFFELVENYPISFDPDEKSTITTTSGTYTKDFKTYKTIPYKVRIDPDALDGNTTIEIRYGYSESKKEYISAEFNLEIKDVRTNFEIFVKDYSPTENILTLEILNIGKSDIEALTLEIPEQKNIAIQGSPKNIIGSLDSNDFTTADFTATPTAGEIEIKIHYTDEIGERRTQNKKAIFEPERFQYKLENGKKNNNYLWIIITAAVIIGLIALYKWRKKKRKKKLFG